MHQDTLPDSPALDQSRITRFAVSGALLAAAVMVAGWIGLSRTDLDPLPASGAAVPAGAAGAAATATADCCPEPTSDAAATPPPSPPTSSSLEDATAGGPVAWLLDTTGFPRRWNCGTWSAELGWMHILGDLSIWGAYMAIPIVLGVFILRGASPLPAPVWLFIAFIFTCGMGHLLESVIFYEPLYRLAGVWKWLVAIVSWATVAALLPTVPQVLRWPRLADLNHDLAVLNGSLDRQRLHVERANQRLRDTNEELEQFVYSASHDLKSPLVTISGFLTHLERDLNAGRTQSLPGHIERIARSTARMRACVDDLLEVSRVGHVTEEIVEVDLRESFRRMSLLLRERLDAAGVSLATELEVDSLLVTPSHLDRALLNLVENAIRYGSTDPEPRIVVGSRRVGDETRLFVSDNGEGIPADHHDRIFELFQRLADDGEGTGVGLTVVQRVATARHGRAWVESEPGRGATFWMSFPDPIPADGDPGTAGRARTTEVPSS